jgi:hypothetical protein
MILAPIRKIFWGERLEWELNIPPEKVLSLVQDKNEGSFVERMFAPGLSVRIGTHGFKVSKLSIGNMPMSGNSFCHILAAKVYLTPSGSKVVTQFRLVWFIFGFVAFWLTLMTFGTLAMSGAVLIEAAKTRDISKLTRLFPVLILPTFAVLLFRGSRMLASSNEKEIKGTLAELFKPYEVQK